MWEENNFAVSLRVKRGHGYFLLASLTVPVSGIFSSFDRVARNVPLDEEMGLVRLPREIFAHGMRTFCTFLSAEC